MGGWFRDHSNNSQQFWYPKRKKKLKDCIINFLNNNSNKSNVSGKLSIKIGSETINIDDAVLFNNGRRNLLSIIDLLDNNINCLFYNQNNKKYKFI